MTSANFIDAMLPGPREGAGPMAPPQGAATAARQQWMREMERAQLAAWKIGVVEAEATAPTASPGHVPADESVAKARTSSETPQSLRKPATATERATPSLSQDRAASPQGASPLAALDACSTSLIGATPSQELAPSERDATAIAATPATLRRDTVARTAHPRQVSASREPVRLSWQDTADGLQLWMGLDAPIARAAPALVGQLLATLAQQGIRPSKVVCNGTLLHESSAADDGTPVPLFIRKEQP